MATRKKKNNIGAFGHPIYGNGFAKYGEMRPNGSSEIPNDLEEAAEKYLDKLFGKGKHLPFYKELFIAGYNLCKDALWKPTPEQLKALNAINCFGELSYQGQQQHLIELYQHLKQLYNEQSNKAVEGRVYDFRRIKEIGYSSAKIEFEEIPELDNGDKVLVIIVKK